MRTRPFAEHAHTILALAVLTGLAGLSTPLRADEHNDEIARLQQELQQTKQKLEDARDRIEELEETIAASGGDPDAAGDVIDPLAAREEGLQPWTHSMQRSPMRVLFPGTATIPKHNVYGSFMHVSRESVNNKVSSGDETDPFHTLFGLDDNVRIGILLGYGITDRWDAWIQRTNGRTVLKDWSGDAASFDYWDVMTKVRFLDQHEHGIDLALYGGITYMMEDDESGNTSANAGITLERSLLRDRLRLSTGLLYSSLSAFESTSVTNQTGDVALTKRLPGEMPSPYRAEGDNHTVAVPFGLTLALTRRWQAFVEGIAPVDGYDTNKGPTLALGGRYATNTHEFAVYIANSANNSFNSILTGGYRNDRIDQFGFSISIYY